MQILISLFLAWSAQAQTSNEEWVARGAKAYHEVLLTCPGRIWPGLDWSRTQMIFASGATKQAWLIGPDARQPELIADAPPTAFQAAFSFLEYRGRVTATILLESPWFDENMSPFDLAVHELFHQVGQKGWARPQGQRGTLVPLDWRPRYVRAEMLSYMQQQLTTGAGIERAANAYRAWFNLYPFEVASTSDGYEGTASYVENVSRLFQKRGCGVGEEELKRELVALGGAFRLYPGVGFDGEGYPLGALAGFLLDLQGVEWKSQMPSGKTPVAILLEGKGNGVNAPDEKLSALYESTFKELNARIDDWRLPFEEKLDSPDYVRVAVPGGWVRGSYSPKGFYIPAADQSLTYTPFDGEHKFTGENGEFITVADGVVGVDKKDADECGGSAWYFLVAKADLAFTNGTFSARTSEAQFSFAGAYKTGADGRTYVCASGK